MKPGNSFSGVLAIILLLVFCHKGLGVETYFIRNYSDLDGLSMNVAVSIVQDDKGFIWIATPEGLNRFNGQVFEIYTKENGLPGNFINTLYIDNHGNFWVGTRKGLCLYRDNRFIPYLYDKNSPNADLKNNINCIAEMEKDKLLVGTADGLLVLKDQELVDYPLESPYLKSNINAITVDKRKKRIYLGTSDNGVLYIENNKIKPIDDRLTGKFILSLLLDGEDLWIGTDGGLNLVRNGKVARTYTKKDLKLSNIAINFIFKEDEKKLWAATSRGLYQVIDHELTAFPKSSYLDGEKILAVTKDREGGIWVGLYGGISYLARSKFLTLSMKDGLPSDSVFGVYPAKDGNIWVATYGGIAVVSEEKLQVIKKYTTSTPLALPSNSVNTIAGDNQGNTWIATYEGGLVQYTRDRFKVFNVKNGLPNNNVRVVYVDSRDNLWLGIKDAGLVRFNKENGKVDNHFKFNTASNPKLLSNEVRCIYDDRSGNLWVGMEGGLCKFQGNKFDESSKKEYLKGHFVNGILKDGAGYWIATFDDGLFYLNESLPGNPKIENHSYKEGFLNNNFYGVVNDEKGRLWIPSNKGIIRYDKENKDENKRVTHYTMKDGLPANENNSYGGVKDSKGRFWFSTHKGIVVVTDVDNPVYENTIEPPVVIEGFMKKEVNKSGEIEYKDITITQEPIILGHNENNIRIKFTALSFRSPGDVKFKTSLLRLPGTQQWEKLKGKDRSVEYTNLPPGDYTFQVKACNNDDKWNETGDMLRFTIKPSFFQTPWFYVLLALLIFIAFYGFYRVRTSQQRRQKEKLEQMVRQRTRELEETQAQLIHQGKMASLGEMAAELAHDMNNPANYIYGNIDLLEKYIADIKSIVWECIKLELPAEHPVNQIKEDLSIEEEVTELDGLIKYVKEGAIRISDIVSNFMAFVGKDETGVQPIDIHGNIETTINLLQNKIKNRVEIKKIFGEIPKIEGYPGPMNQVWMNLLSNAADAITGQGVIIVETSMKDAGHVLIRISDTGAGIAGKNRERIFDPFFTTKADKKGMGLGLAITKKIIEKHNGKIDFESKEGQGTCFSVILPINSYMAPVS